MRKDDWKIVKGNYWTILDCTVCKSPVYGLFLVYFLGGISLPLKHMAKWKKIKVLLGDTIEGHTLWNSELLFNFSNDSEVSLIESLYGKSSHIWWNATTLAQIIIILHWWITFLLRHTNYRVFPCRNGIFGRHFVCINCDPRLLNRQRNAHTHQNDEIQCGTGAKKSETKTKAFYLVRKL